MSETKQPAADPEIPSELRAKLSKSHRPAGYTPKSEADDLTPPPEVIETAPARDLTEFFNKLQEALRRGPFFKTVSEIRDVKRRVPGSRAFEWVRENRIVKVTVEITVGADGLPYPAEAVTAEETRRVRGLTYATAPALEAELGDLTPVFVEWLYLNFPYDAAVRYAGRVTHVQSWALSHA
jgi:hypothetical protein